MAASPRASIFICSSRAPRDRVFSRRLAKDLRKLGYIPIVNRGRSDMPQPAADIERAQTVLVVVSPQLAGSAPARIEYMRALQLGKSVVPVQISFQAAIPQELKEIQWVDFYELYDEGLATLAGYLGVPNARLERRAALARVRGRVINVLRGFLATLMFIARMAVVFGILAASDLGGFGFALLLPVAFFEVAEEDYRRGDAITRRIVISKTLLGAGGGAALVLLPAAASILYTSPSSSSSTADSTSASRGAEAVGAALPLALLLGVIGAALGWLLVVLERRSRDRGGVAFGKVMRAWHFCAQAGLIIYGAGLILAPLAQAPSGGLDPVSIFFTFVVPPLLLAAALEWLRSPVRRGRRGRAQAASAVGPRGKVAPVADAVAGLVFISHSSADNELASRLARDLQTRGVPTWVDRHRLVPGMRWPDAIRQSVDNSSTLVLLLSPIAAASEWVREEYGRAQAKGKAVVVARLDSTCAVPPELSQAPLVEFSALYSKGLLDVLVALGAAPSIIAAVARVVRQRIRYAWLIGTTRAAALGYMFWARIIVFGTASFTLLGCFDRIAGVHSLLEYLPIWLLRAAPGAALGAFVETAEDVSIAGAKATVRIRLAKIVNAALLGVGLFGPVPVLMLLFFSNKSAADASIDSSAVYVILGMIGLSLVSGFFALPIVRIEQRNREQGKAAFVLMMRAARFISRGFVGAIALVIPLYLLIDSPMNLFGPPPNGALGGTAFWALAGAIVGGVMAAIQLFFFPSSLTRKALRRLGGASETEAPGRISGPPVAAAAAHGQRSESARS